MVFFILSLLLTSSVYASEPLELILINEVQIEPLQKVEIVNQGERSVDLSGWYVDDEGGTTYVTISPGTILQPNSCITIEGKFNLNKSSADTVRLFENNLPPTSELAQPVDVYSYEASPGESVSFQRIPDGSTNWTEKTASFGQFNQTLESCQIIATPTPTASILPTPTASLSPTISSSVRNIRISESMVYPDTGDNEWIELYNPNSYEVTLANWYIDDIADGGATPKKFAITLSAGSYGFYELSTGIFNNSGDSVRLLDSQNQIIDSFSYKSSAKNISIGRADLSQNTTCFQEPTKGFENESCLVDDNNVTETPTPTPTAQPSQIKINPDTTVINPAKYIIHVALPTDRPGVQGIHDQTPRPDSKSRVKTSNFLSPAYSLLSIISVAVKMKLK